MKIANGTDYAYVVFNPTVDASRRLVTEYHNKQSAARCKRYRDPSPIIQYGADVMQDFVRAGKMPKVQYGDNVIIASNRRNNAGSCSVCRDDFNHAADHIVLIEMYNKNKVASRNTITQFNRTSNINVYVMTKQEAQATMHGSGSGVWLLDRDQTALAPYLNVDLSNAMDARFKKFKVGRYDKRKKKKK